METNIYKIVNDINNKVYVGKTRFSIEKRFKEHIEDSKRREEEKRPLYNAINKYGAEHFSIFLIEQCDSKIENEREQYWIGYYRGYEEGYNATRGGEGKALYDFNLIKDLLLQGRSTKQIIEEIGCCKDTVHKIAKMYNIQISNVIPKNKVDQYEITGEYIQSFDSYAEAARWLYENNKIPTLNSGVRSHISEACKGKRKTAYKYIWKDD